MPLDEGLPLHELLVDAARDVAAATDGDCCIVSRAIGDLLILVADHNAAELALPHGAGYLISDYPRTGHVLETGRAEACSFGDADCDPAEARLLRELGVQELLMLRLAVGGAAWGLVEVYRRSAGAFAAEDVAAATLLVDALAGRLTAAVAT